jgi:hypothetical protein
MLRCATELQYTHQYKARPTIRTPVLQWESGWASTVKSARCFVLGMIGAWERKHTGNDQQTQQEAYRRRCDATMCDTNHR